MNTRIVFSQEMDRLRHDILLMASRVEEALGKALAALGGAEPALAREVRNADAEIDALQIRIEDHAATLIATQQPVARDLRELVAVFKLTCNLERLGDYAVHAAKAALKFAGESPFRSLGRLEKMGETGREMLRAAVRAYLDGDSAAARAAAALDDRIDREHKALIEETLALMKEHPELIKQAVRLLNTSGFLERLGDRITNMCEAVIYIIESKHEELNE